MKYHLAHEWNRDETKPAIDVRRAENVTSRAVPACPELLLYKSSG